MPLKIKAYTSGRLKNNSYIITDEKTFSIVIDPGENPEQLIPLIGDLPVSYIFLTHCHYDHIYGLNFLKKYTDASVVVHHTEAEWLLDPFLNGSIRSNPIVCEWPDILLNGDEIVQCGPLTIRSIHTPGHSPGSTCYLIDNHHLFTGDTLLAGLVGPTNLPFSDRQLLKDSVKKQLFTLEDNIIVYPGHGPKTTIGFEKENNLFPNIKNFY